MDICVVDESLEIHEAQVSQEEWQKDIFIATLNGKPIIAKHDGWAKDIKYAAFTTHDEAEIFIRTAYSARRGH